MVLHTDVMVLCTDVMLLQLQSTCPLLFATALHYMSVPTFTLCARLIFLLWWPAECCLGCSWSGEGILFTVFQIPSLEATQGYSNYVQKFLMTFGSPCILGKF